MSESDADAARFCPVCTTTAGALVYPLPPAVTVTELIAPPDITAVAVAPLPPPPRKDNVGVPVNPLPPCVTATDATAFDVITATPAALDPPPLGKLTLGALV
jgi:hypothetical protein